MDDAHEFGRAKRPFTDREMADMARGARAADRKPSRYDPDDAAEVQRLGYHLGERLYARARELEDGGTDSGKSAATWLKLLGGIAHAVGDVANIVRDD